MAGIVGRIVGGESVDDIAVKICSKLVSVSDSKALCTEASLMEFLRRHNTAPQMEISVTGVRKEMREAEISRFDPNGFRHTYKRETVNFVKDFHVQFDLSAFVIHESGETHALPYCQKEYALFRDGSVKPKIANASMWGRKAMEDPEKGQMDAPKVSEDPRNNVFLEFLETRFMTRKTLTLEKFVVWDFDEVEEDIVKFFRGMGYSNELRIDFGKKRHLIRVERNDSFYNGDSWFVLVLVVLTALLLFPISIPIYLYFKYYRKRFQDIQIYSDFIVNTNWKDYCDAMKPNLAKAYADSRV